MIKSRVVHRLDFNNAKPAHIGYRAAGHAGKDNACHHVYMSQSARKPTDQRARKPEQPIGNAADIHHLARKDKQRDRQHGK